MADKKLNSCGCGCLPSKKEEIQMADRKQNSCGCLPSTKKDASAPKQGDKKSKK